MICLDLDLAAAAPTVFHAPSYPVFKSGNNGGLSVGDLDGDGRTDLVSSHTLGLDWFRSLGDEGFAPPVPLWGSRVTHTAVVDLDLDGRLDIAGCLYDSSGLVLFYGLGGGAFEPGVVLPVASSLYVSDLQARDLDGDLRPDFVVGMRFDSMFAVLRSNGPRNWDSPDLVPVSPESLPADMVDWNLDGWLDLVVLPGAADSIAIHPGGPGATFGPPWFVANSTVEGIGAGPLDALPGDDLFIASRSGSETRSNQGDGSFGPALPFASFLVYAVELVDLDGDGRLDLAGADAGRVWAALSNGDGTFGTPTSYNAYAAPNDLAAADFDGDGRADVVATGSFIRPLAVYRGNGDGTFGTPLTVPFGWPFDLAIGDVTGDGVPDVVVAERDTGGVDLHVGSGDGTLGPSVRIASIPVARTVRLGDVDNDGDLDVVAGGTDVLVTVPGLPGGGFAPPVSVPGPNVSGELALADLDGDGWLDAVLSSATLPEVRVYQGGPAGFTAIQTIALSGIPRRLAVGTIDAGSTADLAMTIGASMVFHAGTGTGTFVTPGVATPVPADAYALAIDDFDDDGRRDVAVGCIGLTNSPLVILESDGGSGFITNGPWTTSLDPHARATTNEFVVADFDGDGDRDIFGSSGERYSALLLNAGDGTFAERQGFGHFRVSPASAAGDLDGDGGVDVVVAGSNSGGIEVPMRFSSLAVLLNRVAALAAVNEPDAAAPPSLALRMHGNPVGPSSRVSLVAPRGGVASVELFGVDGRRVTGRHLGSLAAGPHALALPELGRLAPGLYWIRVRVADDEGTTRVVVTR